MKKMLTSLTVALTLLVAVSIHADTNAENLQKRIVLDKVKFKNLLVQYAQQKEDYEGDDQELERLIKQEIELILSEFKEIDKSPTVDRALGVESLMNTLNILLKVYF